ncbi:MAG: pyruvate dehydrogenase complex E1 component subunit beta [Hyphomonas sp.]|uniref:pyruvate dehydrogenase complex E1 component subunit beta n=1 Tax=Hyphomonas sp. TaxID=87 RepID=UPI0017FB3203|nr:pyruvate dehydrogenase complex E1 component subunit beta [Hyphomonas sp.]MBA3067223.1 pyruvate dehydrogenase complex E1 component subunit beta [Hyphomonas sp.]MBU3921663.1 pyruvate dehydrogenase complex E1 component subunit beta [Alphaproteobacteria bacterium]MBU4061167.1 pyruvate dehydrogenase complex E1 component subunit beta [Alphaproteobacteria bacterium]MBU4165079.1 pyruvate dehydrogenase complex E1 component subunit beta [Alphaproteobacteria bacterium]
MPVDILMPALSPTMEEGTLSKWLKKEGDTVKSGDIIAEIETDKATMEVEAVDEGILSRIVVPEGTEGVKVNAIIAVLAEDGENIQSPARPRESGDPAPEKVPEPDPRLRGEERTMESPPAARALRDHSLPEGTTFTETTVRDALRDAMAEEMRRDERVFVMGEEVAQYQGAYKVTRELLQEFGERRVIDTPITEHGFAGLGVGAAFAGLRPVVEFMTFNFAMQAIDHIINSAAKTLYMSGGQMGCPIVFRGPNGAASRVGAQHSQDYSAWYAQIPGLKVVAPYDAADAKGLLKAAIRDPNPVVFLEHELLYGQSFPVPDMDDFVLPIGKAAVKREGTDVTLVAHSRMVGFALQAAERLAEEGISAEVIDLRTLRPLDTDTVVESVKKTSRLVCCEEGWRFMGVGAEIAATVVAEAFDYLDAPPIRVHQKDVPLPYAANLEALSLPNADDIVAAAKKVCEGAV